MKKKEEEDDLAWRENKNTTAKNSIGLKSVWRETNLKRLTVNIDFYTRYRRQIFIVREFNKLCTRFGGLTYAVTRCSFFSIVLFSSLSLSLLFFIFAVSLLFPSSFFPTCSSRPCQRGEEKGRRDTDRGISREKLVRLTTSIVTKRLDIMQTVRRAKKAHGERDINFRKYSRLRRKRCNIPRNLIYRKLVGVSRDRR